MLHILHDLHLIFHFLVEDAVLHELALVEFLSGVRNAPKRGGDLVHRSKGAFPNLSDSIISA